MSVFKIAVARSSDLEQADGVITQVERGFADDAVVAGGSGSRDGGKRRDACPEAHGELGEIEGGFVRELYVIVRSVELEGGAGASEPVRDGRGAVDGSMMGVAARVIGVSFEGIKSDEPGNDRIRRLGLLAGIHAFLECSGPQSRGGVDRNGRLEYELGRVGVGLASVGRIEDPRESGRAVDDHVLRRGVHARGRLEVRRGDVRKVDGVRGLRDGAGVHSRLVRPGLEEEGSFHFDRISRRAERGGFVRIGSIEGVVYERIGGGAGDLDVLYAEIGAAGRLERRGRHGLLSWSGRGVFVGASERERQNGREYDNDQ